MRVVIHQLSKRGFTLIEILVVIFIIGLIGSIVIVNLWSVRVRARDTTRIADAKQVLNGLALYQGDNGGKLPDNGENDCGGWDAGTLALGPNNTFIKSLSDASIMIVPKEKWNADPCSYRYFKFSDYGCGNGITYAILGVRLEGRKQDYDMKTSIESCYPDLNTWPSNDHWIGYMIREGS